MVRLQDGHLDMLDMSYLSYLSFLPDLIILTMR